MESNSNLNTYFHYLTGTIKKRAHPSVMRAFLVNNLLFWYIQVARTRRRSNINREVLYSDK